MKRAPVLIICDEVATYGKNMKVLQNCMGMGAGAAGIQLMLVLQDSSQLRSMFEAWPTFIQNCGVTLWFGLRDPESRDLVSKLAGTCEVITRSRSANIDRQTGEVVVSESGSQYSRPLIHPHEAGQIGRDEMIAFVEGVNGPIRAKRKPYWKVSRFKGLFRKNPYVNNNGGGLLGRLFG